MPGSTPMIPEGAALPEGGSAPTASTLLAQFNAMSDGDKATFRGLIAPRHSQVANQAAMLALTSRRPGDTALREDNDSLYQYQGGDSTQAGNWLLLYAPPA